MNEKLYRPRHIWNDYRPCLDRVSTDYRPLCRPTVDRVSTDCRPSVDRLSTECRPPIDPVSTAMSTDISVDITHSKQDPKSQGSNSKFIKNQWNVSHDCLIHACSFSASTFHEKSTCLGKIILRFFACALRHCSVMTGYYVTLKYQAKPRTIAWKVFATLKWLDST